MAAVTSYENALYFSKISQDLLVQFVIRDVKFHSPKGSPTFAFQNISCTYKSRTIVEITRLS